MRNFKQQLKAYGDEMRNSRCPYTEAELDKEIRSVIWSASPTGIPYLPSGGNAGGRVSSQRDGHRRLWSAVAAAAILAAIIIPTAIFTSKGNSTGGIVSVKVDGEYIYFACNNGCSADATIETFKSLLR